MQKRTALYHEFQRIVVNDAPIRFISMLPYYTVSRDELKNRPEGIWGPIAPWNEVYLDK